MAKDDSSVLRDSALIITAATALLFVWGYAFEAYRWTGASVPGLFQPEVAIQERALVGGMVALFIFVPTAIIGWIIDQVSGNRILNWFSRNWAVGPVHQIVIVSLFFAISIGLVRPIANVSDRFGRRLRVEKIVMKDGSLTQVQPGMYCIGRRSGTYVFVDKIATDSRKIFLLAEDQISELVLNYVKETAQVAAATPANRTP